MKILYVITILFLCCSNGNAQAPNWQWVRDADKGHANYSSGLSTDINGNVYVSGYFYDTIITFGSDTLINNSTTGGHNILLVKYDSSGNVIWAKSAGGTDNDDAASVITDGNANVYVTGEYQSLNIIFGSDTLNAANNVGGVGDFFIVKYNSAGNVVWAKHTGGGGSDYGTAIGADVNDNIYAIGSFSPTITFDTITLTNQGFFIVKYDSSGNAVWAKDSKPFGYVGSFGSGISTDINANAYVTGDFATSLIGFGSDTLINGGLENFFVVKYGPSGNVIWAKAAAGTGSKSYNYSYGICTDANSNTYVTGFFLGPIIVFGNDTLTNADTTEIENAFIVKYDSSGYVIWAKSAKGHSEGSGVCVDASGYVYLTGDFTAPFIVFGTDTLINSGENTNIFIVKYSSAGNVIWTKSTGGTGRSIGNIIITDANSNVYVSGQFINADIDFDGTTLIDTNSGNNLFLAKLSNPVATGITNEFRSFSSGNVYPNPSTGTFYFSGLQKNNTIEIYNVLGEMESFFVSNNGNYCLSLSNKAKGVYFYRVMESGNTLWQGKIIVD